MAEKKSYLKWFLSELPQLTEKGVISGDTAAALDEYYRAKLTECSSPQKLFSLVVGIIGIVMVGAGVILFLNYNWDMFPKALRIALAAFPLAAGAAVSYFTIFKGKGQVWREVSAILTSVGAGTMIAVLSQIYHTGGELNEFMFLLLLISLPLIYIFNSAGLASLYVVLSFWVNSFNSPLWWNGLVLLLFLPWLFFSLRENSSVKVWCRYLALVAGISFLVSCALTFTYMLATVMLLCTMFFMGGMNLIQEERFFGKNPWLVPGFLVQTVFLAIGSSNERLFKIESMPRISAEMWMFYGSLILPGVLLLLLFIRRRITLERCLCLLPALLGIVPLFYKNPPLMRVLFNCALGLSGIVFIYKGIKRSSLVTFNAGAVMVCVLAGCRFFDSQLGLLYRSAGLVVLGAGFILGNWFIVKFNREAGK